MSERRARILGAVSLAGALLCALGFWDAAALYEHFRIDYGRGLFRIPLRELALYAWYLTFGLPAAILLARALAATSLPARANAAVRRLAERPWRVVGAAVVLLLVQIGWFQLAVLQQAPIADDESSYVFSARTLLEGRLVNPAPEDADFFQSQYVVLGEHGWYGKYPIGHPLLLAAGEAVGLRRAVVPLLACASLALVFAVGRRLFSPAQALVAVALLLISPHFVWTSATELSQPSATLFTLLGVFALLRFGADPRPRWAALAGAAFGFGLLIRPMPGAPFLAVAAGYLLLCGWTLPARQRVAAGLAAAAPVIASAVVLLWVNDAQTGEATRTGYQAVHDTLGFFPGRDGRVGGSVGASLLRQNFWLFGWPLSLAFAAFATAHRDRRGLGLLWALVAAEYVYRMAVPKAVVATTGPIYVTEIVPLLALLGASGMARAARELRARGFARGPEGVCAFALGSTAVALLLFAPLQLRQIARSGERWQTARELVAETGAERALVFANYMVDPDGGDSWAYYPPAPSPTLDDDVLFVRQPPGPDGLRAGLDLWRRRFPDRRAFVFQFIDHRPTLAELRPAGGGA